jgi:hypothetical protein
MRFLADHNLEQERLRGALTVVGPEAARRRAFP